MGKKEGGGGWGERGEVGGGGGRGAYRVLVRKLERKRTLGNPDVDKITPVKWTLKEL